MKNLVDYILEFNNALSNKKIIQEIDRFINKEYKSDIEECDIEYEPTNNDISNIRIFISGDNASDLINKLYKNKSFKDYLYARKWYITKHNANTGLIIIEPIDANDITDKIYKDFNGIVYHITLSKNVKTILNTGLRPKQGNSDFRLFDDNGHIYVYMSNDFEELCNITKSIINDKKLSNRKDDYKWSTYNISVLKIDLNKINSTQIIFYKDTYYFSSEVRNAAYTKYKIPAKCITDVTKEIINYID